MSMKTSNDTIGNRTCDLPTCSAVPQPTAIRRAPSSLPGWKNFLRRWVAHAARIEHVTNLYKFWSETLKGTNNLGNQTIIIWTTSVYEIYAFGFG